MPSTSGPTSPTRKTMAAKKAPASPATESDTPARSPRRSHQQKPESSHIEGLPRRSTSPRPKPADSPLLEPVVLRSVVKRLDPKSVVNLSTVKKSLKASLTEEAAAANLAHRAMQCQSFQDLKSLMDGDLSQLPMHVRAQPLEEMLIRAHHLPDAQRTEAIAAIQSKIDQLGSGQKTDRLKLIVESRLHCEDLLKRASEVFDLAGLYEWLGQADGQGKVPQASIKGLALALQPAVVKQVIGRLGEIGLTPNAVMPDAELQPAVRAIKQAIDGLEPDARQERLIQLFGQLLKDGNTGPNGAGAMSAAKELLAVLAPESQEALLNQFLDALPSTTSLDEREAIHLGKR